MVLAILGTTLGALIAQGLSRALIAFLTSPAAAAAIARSGMDPVAPANP